MLTRARIGMAIGAVIAGVGIGIAGAYMLDVMPSDGSGGGEQTAGGPGGPFTLTAHTGATVTEETFRGRYILLFFGYAHCPDVCPTTLRDKADVLEILGDDAAAVAPLFVTVDPDRDTVGVLAEYVPFFDARILGLTGTEEQIQATVDAYNAYRGVPENPEDPSAYLVDHTAAIYLMDREGGFIRVFSYQTPSAEMAEAMRAIIRADASS